MATSTVPFRLAEMSWPAVEAALEETATMLLPVGATEQHGHHLPLGVDVLMPEAIAERVARRTDCLLAPTVDYGVSPHHQFKPGTFSVGTETFQRYVRDVCQSAHEWGVENVVMLNGHYLAQDAELDVVVRRLRNEVGMTAFHAPLSALWADVATAERTGEVAFHAAEFETSVMLALRPDLVEMESAVAVDVPEAPLPLTDYDVYGDNPVGWALSAADMADLTPAGNLGDPSGATAEMGERMVEAATSRLTTLVEALDAR